MGQSGPGVPLERSSVKRALILVASAGVFACSSTNPCQTSQTPLDYGTCSDLVDAGGGPILGRLTITPAQRTACETACSSSNDQTAVTNAFNCLNAIPADAGACSSGDEAAWGTRVAAQAIGCETALQAQASSACVNAVTATPDGG
jgi:hypothetical protein